MKSNIITMLVESRGYPFYKLVLYNVYLTGLTKWSTNSSMKAIFCKTELKINKDWLPVLLYKKNRK